VIIKKKEGKKAMVFTLRAGKIRKYGAVVMTPKGKKLITSSDPLPLMSYDRIKFLRKQKLMK
jgi:hypothetical protein